MRISAWMSDRHRIGADPTGALAEDRAVLLALACSADGLTLAEPGSGNGYWNPAPLDYAAYLAAPGAPDHASVRLLPLGLSNPVELAEQLATLDHAWNGRFAATLVVPDRGRSARHGRDPDAARERFEEGLTILRAMWAGHPFRADGPHYRFPQVRPTLLPATACGPELSLAAYGEADARFAAQSGLGLHLPAGVSPERAAVLARAYRAEGGSGELSMALRPNELGAGAAGEQAELDPSRIDLHVPGTDSVAAAVDAWSCAADALRP